MHAALPKQYLRFQGKAILEHTLDRLFSYTPLDGIMLVLSADDEHWSELNYQNPGELQLTNGGEQRIHSVMNGLTALRGQLSDKTLILVHDAVRPLVAVDDLQRVVEAACTDINGALLAVPVADTIKRSDAQGLVAETVPRDNLWRALTPQVFELSRLRDALQVAVAGERILSDDCAAMELAGYQPKLVRGAGSNIKITVPEDLLLAEQIWLYQSDQDNNK